MNFSCGTLLNHSVWRQKTCWLVFRLFWGDYFSTESKWHVWCSWSHSAWTGRLLTGGLALLALRTFHLILKATATTIHVVSWLFCVAAAPRAVVFVFVLLLCRMCCCAPGCHWRLELIDSLNAAASTWKASHSGGAAHRAACVSSEIQKSAESTRNQTQLCAAATNTLGVSLCECCCVSYKSSKTFRAPTTTQQIQVHLESLSDRSLFVPDTTPDRGDNTTTQPVECWGWGGDEEEVKRRGYQESEEMRLFDGDEQEMRRRWVKRRK